MRSGLACSEARRRSLSSSLRKRAGVAFEDHARDLRLVNLHAQHAAAGERVVERQLGLHVAIALVQLDDRVDDGARADSREIGWPSWSR